MMVLRRPLTPLLLAAAMVLAACSGGGGGAGEGTAPAPGGFSAEVELAGDHALVGRLVIESDGPIRPRIEVVGTERRFEIPVAAAAERHEIPVVGLRADQDYQVVVGAGGDQVELGLRTGALPEDLPALRIAAAEPDAMSEGFTVFNIIGREHGDPPRAGLAVAVDAEGEVVWYHRADHPIGDLRQLDDGTILHEYNDTGARRVDLFGETLQEWAGEIISGPLRLDAYGRQVVGDDAIEVATDSMHHEVGVLDDGNLVAVSSELLTYDGFEAPLCGEGEDFDGSYDLIVDVIVEFTPDGEIVAEYPLADHLDPVGQARDQNVCGLPFDDVFPNWLYRAQGEDEALDWTHANAVVPAPGGDALTVSVRHLDAIMQIDRATGELLWRFGPGGDLEVGHPSDFSSHQHAPEWQDDGTLLVYDNGNQRAPAPGEPADTAPTTRAVQYRIDPDAGTAEVVWSYTATVDGEPAFASFVGDADRLANGNVLMTNGGYADRPDGVSAQIVEIVPDGSAEGGHIVFDLRLDDPDQLVIYRAERFETFYPGP
jgi:arylsulfate sulfotransferase